MQASSLDWALYYPPKEPLTPIAVQWFHVRQHARWHAGMELNHRLPLAFTPMGALTLSYPRMCLDCQSLTRWQIVLIKRNLCYRVRGTVVPTWIVLVKLDCCDRSGSNVGAEPPLPTHFKRFPDFKISKLHELSIIPLTSAGANAKNVSKVVMGQGGRH